MKSSIKRSSVFFTQNLTQVQFLDFTMLLDRSAPGSQHTDCIAQTLPVTSGFRPSAFVLDPPDLSFGQCWSLQGQQGLFLLLLPNASIVSNITIGRKSKEWRSAPREIELWGLHEDGPLTLLASILYHKTYGNEFQTFRVSPMRTRFLLLKIISNWGKSAFTNLCFINLFCVLQ